jgi:hypothetical protein
VHGQILFRFGQGFQRNGDVLSDWRICWQAEEFAGRTFLAFDDWSDEVGNWAGQVNAFVHIISRIRDRSFVDPRRGTPFNDAVKVEANIFGVCPEHPPTDINLPVT